MNFFLLPLLESPFCAARQVPSAEPLPTIKARSPCQISLIIPNCSEPLRYPASPSSTLTPPFMEWKTSCSYDEMSIQDAGAMGMVGTFPAPSSHSLLETADFLYFQFQAGFFPKWNLHRISLKVQQLKIPCICDHN